MSMDIDRVKSLLVIIRESAAHSNKLSSVAQTAFNELAELNETLRVELAKKAEAEKKAVEAEAAKKAAEVAAQTKRDELANNPRAIPSGATRTTQEILADRQRRAEDPNARPTVYPGDSRTATIADRRV